MELLQRPVSEEDLLAVYAEYPRHIGKSDGLKALRKTVRTAAELAECFRAVRNFARAVEGREMQYIRHFDRWARTWRDWLDCTERSTPIGPVAVVSGDELRAWARRMRGEE